MPREAKRQYGEKTKKKQSVAGQEAVRRAKTEPAEPAPRRKSRGTSLIQLMESTHSWMDIHQGGRSSTRGADLRGVGIPEVVCGSLEAGEGPSVTSIEQQQHTPPPRGYKNGGRTMADRRDELARRKRKRRKRRCITFLVAIALLALSGLCIGTYLAVRQAPAEDEGSGEPASGGDGTSDGSGERASGIDEALERSPAPRATVAHPTAGN